MDTIKSFLTSHKAAIESMALTFFGEFFTSVGTAIITYSATGGSVTWSVVSGILTAAVRQALKSVYNSLK